MQEKIVNIQEYVSIVTECKKCMRTQIPNLEKNSFVINQQKVVVIKTTLQKIPLYMTVYFSHILVKMRHN